jgi:small neutral amino acid transporter SnatA (MarC family)
VHFELSYGDIGILFFLTLGPLKAILPFARVTRGTEPAFQRTVAWRSTAIATAIILLVALAWAARFDELACLATGIMITCGIILFYQALRIILQTPAAVQASADRETTPSPPSPAIAVFPIATLAIVTAPKSGTVPSAVVTGGAAGKSRDPGRRLWNVPGCPPC